MAAGGFPQVWQQSRENFDKAGMHDEARKAEDPRHLNIVQTERLVLRALCQARPGGLLRERAEVQLRAYRWRDPVHGLVFEILLLRAGTAPEILASRLPALLTRRGFPIVAWEDLFESHTLSEEEALRLIRQLRDTA